jgi:hypothetical protein
MKKNKYRVLASYRAYVYADIYAENIDEAKEIAYNMDGGDFHESEFGDWNIDEVVNTETLDKMFRKENHV